MLFTRMLIGRLNIIVIIYKLMGYVSTPPSPKPFFLRY